MHEPDFEASADMRLLELQREALGLSAPDLSSWQSRMSPPDGSPIESETTEAPQGSTLVIEMNASPSGGVIPGAVVTMSLTIANDGGAPAHGVVVAVPLPGGASYRSGSFVWDGRPTYDDIAERFFGDGFLLDELAAQSRATFVWKIGVRIGAKPLVIAPSVRAHDSGIIGARPISIDRKAAPQNAFGGELQRAEPSFAPTEIVADELPIYELDAEEEIVHEAAQAALSPAVQPRVVEPVVEPPPVAPPPPPPPVVVLAPAAAPPTPPTPPAAPKPVPVRDALVLTGIFDRASLSFFERSLRGSKPPTILSHCVFAGAMACSRSFAEGADLASLAQHLDAQSQILHRIVLHEKLGRKEPIGGYSGELLADLTALSPVPVAAKAYAESDAGRLILAAELSGPTLQVIARLETERDRWDFVKARQLTLALQAQTVVGEKITELARAQFEAAARAYAQASVTTLQKLFVRIRVDRTTAILSSNEPALDRAGAALLTALAALF
jgi:uncharacterized repeat protein (TIGR01451 family)